MAHSRLPRFPPHSFAARWVRWGRWDMVDMGVGAYVAQGLLEDGQCTNYNEGRAF